MAEKKFIKGSEEWMLLWEFCILCQSIWVPEGTDEYWEDAFGRGEAFVEKYKTDFAKGLFLALWNEIVRRGGGGREK